MRINFGDESVELTQDNCYIVRTAEDTIYD